MIRAARSTDAGRVGALLTQGVGGFDWMPKLHSGAEDIAHAGQMIARGWVQVHDSGAGIDGFLARCEDDIHALYVAQARRGQGIGTALLRAAQGARDRLSLWTFEANTGAQRFYVQRGFAERARTDGAGNDEGLPDIHYVWTRERAAS